jgi:hypothetical protein
LGFDKIVELNNGAATKPAVISRLDELAELAKAGDEFLFVFLGLGGQASSDSHAPVLCCTDIGCARAVNEPCQITLSVLASHLAAIASHCTVVLDCGFAVSRFTLQHKKMHRGAAPSWPGRHVKRSPSVAPRTTLNSPTHKQPSAAAFAPNIHRDFTKDVQLRRHISRLEAFSGNEKAASRFLQALSSLDWPAFISESQLPLFIDSIGCELLMLHHIDVQRSGRCLHRRMDLHSCDLHVCDAKQPLSVNASFSALESSQNSFTLFCASDFATDACEVVDETGSHGALSLSLCDAIEAAVDEEHVNGLRSSWKDIHKSSMDWHESVRIPVPILFQGTGTDRAFFGPPQMSTKPISMSHCVLNAATQQIEFTVEADHLEVGDIICIGTEAGAELICVDDVLPSIMRFINTKRDRSAQIPSQQSGNCWIAREIAKATVISCAAGVSVLEVSSICPPFPRRASI